jgi:hypothetical protein
MDAQDNNPPADTGEPPVYVERPALENVEVASSSTNNRILAQVRINLLRIYTSVIFIINQTSRVSVESYRYIRDNIMGLTTQLHQIFLIIGALGLPEAWVLHQNQNLYVCLALLGAMVLGRLNYNPYLLLGINIMVFLVSFQDQLKTYEGISLVVLLVVIVATLYFVVHRGDLKCQLDLKKEDNACVLHKVKVEVDLKCQLDSKKEDNACVLHKMEMDLKHQLDLKKEDNAFEIRKLELNRQMG